MDTQAYIEEIKFRLTGGLLETELDDSSFQKILNISLREIQRYIDTVYILTIPYQDCIDFNNLKDINGNKIDLKINSITRIFRSEGFSSSGSDGSVDPMQVAQWQILSGTGNLYNFQNYIYNYAAWNTIMQIRNTTSTDLAYYYDKPTNKLYINISTSKPEKITIQYIPRFDSVEDIVSDYWIDVLMNLATANAKIVTGRIRTRYKQSGGLWEQDGDTILEEGKTELSSIREALLANTQLCYPID